MSKQNNSAGNNNASNQPEVEDPNDVRIEVSEEGVSQADSVPQNEEASAGRVPVAAVPVLNNGHSEEESTPASVESKYAEVEETEVASSRPPMGAVSADSDSSEGKSSAEAVPGSGGGGASPGNTPAAGKGYVDLYQFIKREEDSSTSSSVPENESKKERKKREKKEKKIKKKKEEEKKRYKAFAKMNEAVEGMPHRLLAWRVLSTFDADLSSDASSVGGFPVQVLEEFFPGINECHNHSGSTDAIWESNSPFKELVSASITKEDQSFCNQIEGYGKEIKNRINLFRRKRKDFLNSSKFWSDEASTEDSKKLIQAKDLIKAGLDLECWLVAQEILLLRSLMDLVKPGKKATTPEGKNDDGVLKGSENERLEGLFKLRKQFKRDYNYSALKGRETKRVTHLSELRKQFEKDEHDVVSRKLLNLFKGKFISNVDLNKAKKSLSKVLERIEEVCNDENSDKNRYDYFLVLKERLRFLYDENHVSQDNLKFILKELAFMCDRSGKKDSFLKIKKDLEELYRPIRLLKLQKAYSSIKNKEEGKKLTVFQIEKIRFARLREFRRVLRDEFHISYRPYADSLPLMCYSGNFGREDTLFHLAIRAGLPSSMGVRMRIVVAMLETKKVNLKKPNIIGDTPLHEVAKIEKNADLLMAMLLRRRMAVVDNIMNAVEGKEEFMLHLRDRTCVHYTVGDASDYITAVWGEDNTDRTPYYKAYTLRNRGASLFMGKELKKEVQTGRSACFNGRSLSQEESTKEILLSKVRDINKKTASEYVRSFYPGPVIREARAMAKRSCFKWEVLSSYLFSFASFVLAILNEIDFSTSCSSNQPTAIGGTAVSANVSSCVLSSKVSIATGEAFCFLASVVFVLYGYFDRYNKWKDKGRPYFKGRSPVLAKELRFWGLMLCCLLSLGMQGMGIYITVILAQGSSFTSSEDIAKQLKVGLLAGSSLVLAPAGNIIDSMDEEIAVYEASSYPVF